MKAPMLIGILVLVIIVIGGAYLFMHQQQPAAQPTTGGSEPTATIPSTQPSTGVEPSASGPLQNPGASASAGATVNTPAPAPARAPAAKGFSVHGNDATADLTTITVAKGTPVTITFAADAGTTYHGGLDFRSSVVSTGTIAPGSSKAVSFVATNSFAFTPYWPSTNIAKPYTINVVVN